MAALQCVLATLECSGLRAGRVPQASGEGLVDRQTSRMGLFEMDKMCCFVLGSFVSAFMAV